ncbi:hypothetical protein LguiA_021414 [Lonicera macranthoides]
MSPHDNSFQVSSETEEFLCDRLLDQNQPISERFRALFSLRNIKGPAPRRGLILATKDSSNLLAHEAAFALGQMQDSDAIPDLETVLNDLSLHPIVRHEAAEALGAIGSESVIPLLRSSLVSDPAQEVRETCELALSRIEELKKKPKNDESSIIEVSPFLSVDPAAPASYSSVQQLREVLLNEEKGMYERYGALFGLRNHGGDEAMSAIIECLHAQSALLRHEFVGLTITMSWGLGPCRSVALATMNIILESYVEKGFHYSEVGFVGTAQVAYVLGQLQNKTASDALSRVLRDANEHPMVRHEAAEALGSIADGKCLALLEEFAKDPEPIVSQSCEVALSMLEFERSGKSFEYLFMKTPRVQDAAAH